MQDGCAEAASCPHPLDLPPQTYLRLTHQNSPFKNFLVCIYCSASQPVQRYIK